MCRSTCLLPAADHVTLVVRLCAPADQDSVRLLAVESCGKLAEALSSEDCRAQLLPVVHKFVQVGGCRGLSVQRVPQIVRWTASHVSRRSTLAIFLCLYIVFCY